MIKLRHTLFRAGCLVSAIAPIIAIAIYPRATWLFAFLLLGVGLVVLGVVTTKQPTSAEVAERAEQLLDGTYDRWAVDDYEHLNPKNGQLKDLWRSTMSIGGLPEEWSALDDQAKSKIREIISAIKKLESTG